MGEFDLLAKLRDRLPPNDPRVRLGSGDDAAVTVPGSATATSVDAIVDGVHFRRAETTPQLIGRKAVSTALSDLAAMGADAGEVYVALGAPADLGEEEFFAVLDGMLAVC
jgi:thiamine-monophosphate kinase